MKFQASLLLGLFVVLLLQACNSKISRNNPYDPESTGTKHPGRIEGSVYIQGADDQSNIEIYVYDEEETRVDGGQLVTGEAGDFLSAELTPGVYSIEVQVPVGNVPISVRDIEVLPAQNTKVGTLTSLREPPEGKIYGQVSLEQSSSAPSDVRVIATRLENSESFITYTDNNGEYIINDLPSGNYEIRADKAGFTPDLVTTDVGLSKQSQQFAPEMHLFPASAVVRFSVNTDQGQVLGAPYTNSQQVDLIMLAFGGVNQMRFSENENLQDDSNSDLPWMDHLAQVPVTLSADEGLKTMYAQFRIVDLDGRERLRTDIYQTTITYDNSPPVITNLVLDSNATVKEGQRFLSGDPTSVPLQVTALDSYSRIAGIRVLVDDADTDDTPYNVVSSPEATFSYQTIIAFNDLDGVKTAYVQLRDGAGNESQLYEASVIYDTLPPAILAEPAIVVRGADNGQIRSNLITLQMFIGEDLGAGQDGPVRMQYGPDTAMGSSTMVSFLPEVSMLITQGHGETVRFYGTFEDLAGNQITVYSPTYTVNLQGSISGVVYLEGFPEDESLHGDTLVSVYNVTDDISTASPVVPQVATLPSGAFVVNNVPQGNYQVRIARTGAITQLRSPVEVSAGNDTVLGVIHLVLARGTLAGRYQYGDLDVSANHGGISVTAILGGKVVSSAVTGPAGYVTMPSLPVSNTYEIQASADGYLTNSILGVAVTQDETNAINNTPMGCNPESDATTDACNFVSLAKLAGDFKICSSADVSDPPKDCSAILYTKNNQVLLGLEAENVTHVRYTVQNPSNPGEDSFDDPSATPSTDLCPVGLPQEDCWNEYNTTDRYLVDVTPQGEGRVTIVVQFANNSDKQTPGSSSVVYDVTAPLDPSLTISKGSAALLQGFTNDTELSLLVSAVATYGPSDTAAPLATIQVSRDNVWDGNGISGDREYSYGSNILFDVASGDGNKDVYAWFCDAANNCTASGDVVTDSIILDTIPPTRTQGRDITPTIGPGISLKDLITRNWWTVSTRYSVDINVGHSVHGVEEVAAYRLSLSENFVGATWTNLDLTAIDPDDIITTDGIELPPVDGDYLVYAQFKDAAGNLSNELLEDRFALSLDTIPPGGTVSIESGLAYTNNTDLDVALTTDAIGGATHIQYTWTGILPDPYSGSKQAYNSSLVIPASAGDGEKTLLVRFFDEAGNFSERQDSIVVDTTPPDADASAQCATCSQDTMGNLYFKDSNGEITMLLIANDNSGRIDHVEAVIDGDTGNPVSFNYALYATLSVSLVQGDHTVQITFFDPAGNQRALAPFTVIYDTVAPSLSVSINGGNVNTNDPDVVVGITASDSNPLDSLLVSNSPTYSGAQTLSMSTAVNWRLADPDTDGSKRVYVKVFDIAGNEAEADDTITLSTRGDISGNAYLAEQSDHSGISVNLSGSDINGNAVSTSTTTNSAGAYSFSAIKGGSYQLTFSTAGFQSVTSSFGHTAGSDTSMDDVTLAILTSTITGTITLSAGSTGLDVSGSREGVALTLTNSDHSYSAVSDASGNFVFNSVAYDLGEDYTLSANLYGYSNNSRSVNVDQSTVASQNLTLTVNAGSISASIQLQGTSDHSGVTPTIDGVAFNGQPFTKAGSATPSTGAISITNVPAGTYSLTASKTNYESLTKGPFGLTPGQARALGTIGILTIATGDIAGRATLVSGIGGFSVGSDFSGIIVELTGTGLPSNLSTTTNANGDYGFSDVPVCISSCSYTITIRKANFSSNTTSVTIGAGTTATPAVNPLSISVNAGSISGYAYINDNVNNSGRNPTHTGNSVDLSGTAFNNTSFSASTTTASNGSYGFTDVPPGSYTVIASLANHTEASKSNITVSAGSLTNVAAMDLYDEVAPSAPTVTTSSAATVNFDSIVVTIANPSSDSTAPLSNFRGYQLKGGSDYSDWTNVSSAASYTFGLEQNRSNLLQVRGVDWLGNVSDPDSVIIIEDSTAPNNPTNLAVDNRNGEVQITWTASTSSDVAGYKLYYGSQPSSDLEDFLGNFADQGQSPIDVSNNTSFTLSGLVNGSDFRVRVTAYDSTVEPQPNESTGSSAVDASPTELPLRLAGELEFDGAEDIEVQHGYAYVTNTISGFSVFRVDELIGSSIDSPATPVATLSAETRGKVELFGDVAYLFDRDVPGLRLINISDPENPVAIGTTETSRCFHNFIPGHRVYDGVNDGVYGYGVYRYSYSSTEATCISDALRLLPFDMADPATLVAGSYATILETYTGNDPLETVFDMQIVNDRLHLAIGRFSDQETQNSPLTTLTSGSTNEFQTWDISAGDTAVPTFNASRSCDTSYVPLGMDMSGSYAYLGIGYQGLDIMYYNSCSIPRTISIDNDRVGKVMWVGNYLYLGMNQGTAPIKVYDTSSSDILPRLVGSLEHAMYSTYSPSLSGSISYYDTEFDRYGNHIFQVVAKQSSTTTEDDNAVIVITELAQPRTVQPLVSVADADFRVQTMHHQYLFGFTAGDELKIIDVSNPDSPSTVATTDISGAIPSTIWAGHAVMFDDDRYMAAALYRNLSSPPSIQIALIDVSYPSSPQYMGGYENTSFDEIHDIEVHGNALFVSGDDRLLYGFNITDPNSISTYVDSYCTGCEGSGFDIVGNYAYVGRNYTTNRYVYRLAVDDTGGISYSASYIQADMASVASVTASGNVVTVLGSGAVDLRLYQRSNMSVQSTLDGITALSVAHAYGDLAIFSNYSSIYIYDISDPTNPTFKAYLESDSTAKAFIYGPFILVSNSSLDLFKLE